MTRQQINISKVTPPWKQNFLHRPRLTTLLESNRDKRVILITGPAAQGKTTLAASYAGALKCPWAWATLDAGESDPIQFFHTLVQALQHAFPEKDFTPQLNYPAMRMGLRREIPLYREWTRIIFDGLSQPLCLFIDDLNMLNTDAPVFSFLGVMLDEAPRNVRFILMSREIPPIDFQRMKIRRLAVHIAQEELAFTQAETSLFFKDIFGLSLSEKEAARISTYTEGWVGGLILVADLLKRLPMEEKSQLSLVEQTARFKQETFQYFSEELFSTQPEKIQTVLLESSIFNVVEPQLMESFLPGIGVGDILNEIGERNLFLTVHEVGGRHQGLRYHNLFREFLKDRLLSKNGPDGVAALHTKAAGLFEARKDFENAADYYLGARAFSQAAACIVRAGRELAQMGKMVRLAGWLKALPEQLVRQDPWLLYYQAMTVRFTETRENIDRLTNSYALFEAQENIAGQMASLGLLIEASLMSGKDLTPLRLLMKRAERLIHLDHTDRHAFEKATLLLIMGIIYPLRLWEPQKGYQTSWDAYIILRRFGVVPLQIHALSHAFLSQQMMGDLVGAEKTRRKIGNLVKECHYPEIKTYMDINLIQYYSLTGGLEKAQERLRHSRSEVERMGLVYLMPPLQIQDLMLRPHLKDFVGAEQIGTQLMEMAGATDNLLSKGLARLFLGASYCHKADYKQSETLIRGSIDIFSSDMAYSRTHILTANHFLGIINYHLGRYDQAARFFQESFCITGLLETSGWQAYYFLGMALIRYHQNEWVAARDCLSKAFVILEKNKIEFLIWMDRRDVANACLLTVELRAAGAVPYAAHLLTHRFSDVAGPGLEKLAAHSDVWVSEKARAIILDIHRSGVPRLWIKTLNGFEVLRGGTALTEADWQRNRAQTLLKAIIARGGKKVPKDVVIEDLWPECNVETGERNFKVTLHRLRKSLEPGLHKSLGSAYVHLDDKRISLDPELCEVDADVFASLIAEGKNHHQQGRRRLAKQCFNKAIDIYQDDFLPGDLYEDWAAEKRSKLRMLYLDTLLTLAPICTDQGAWKKAERCYLKAIDSDSLLEEAYRGLMVLYDRQGMHSHAVRVYETCKFKLREALQVPPAKKTMAIYKKIMENLPSK
ncbi:tetratricopeptide repeat protein [delta proteobacterium NaphS2]|nr:tetratricopeptide repeat protein [delta proteobacterium NaphS2]